MPGSTWTVSHCESCPEWLLKIFFHFIPVKKPMDTEIWTARGKKRWPTRGSKGSSGNAATERTSSDSEQKWKSQLPGGSNRSPWGQGRRIGRQRRQRRDPGRSHQSQRPAEPGRPYSAWTLRRGGSGWGNESLGGHRQRTSEPLLRIQQATTQLFFSSY